MYNNIWMTWGDVFSQSLQGLWWSFVQFTPRLVIAVILFIIGWVLGSIIAKALEQVFTSLKVDKLFSSVGAEGFFRKAGLTLDTGYFIGQVVKWFIIVVFLLPSLNLVGLDNIASFLKDDVLTFLPKVVVAALILVIASVVADGLSSTVRASVKSMGLTSANLLATVAKYAVWVFAFIIALGQLGVADYYMGVLFTGIIAMLSLGGALAFGLGGKDAAARFIGKVQDEVARR